MPPPHDPQPNRETAAPGRRRQPRVELHGWRHPAVLTVAAFSAASGFAQFGVVAALGDVARTFGDLEGPGFAAQAGLSGTTLGIGLAIIRLASLGALPLAGLADHHGRRRVLLFCCAGGLACTAAAALSPGFWWFVAIFALGRPLLSATNVVAGVIAAEETSTAHRTKALALMSAGYGIGAGATALIRGVAAEQLGFRGLFSLALVVLALVPLLARRLHEPDRYTILHEQPEAQPPRWPRLGDIRPNLRPRLLLLCGLTGAVGFVTGPINTNVFLFAENILGVSPAMMAVVVMVAGPTGLVGLLVGRWAADRLGRRVTATAMMAGIAVAGVVTYSGTVVGIAVGYQLGIICASAYAPAAGAIATELFPTSSRATAAGWLTAAGVLGAVTGLLTFGLLADALQGFERAAVVLALPVALLAALYLRLPETHHLELEESAPEA
jgi:MFS family permease